MVLDVQYLLMLDLAPSLRFQGRGGLLPEGIFSPHEVVHFWGDFALLAGHIEGALLGNVFVLIKKIIVFSLFIFKHF